MVACLQAAAEAVGRYHAFLHRVTAARTRLLDLIFRAHDTGADDWARRDRVLEVVAGELARKEARPCGAARVKLVEDAIALPALLQDTPVDFLSIFWK